MSVTQALNDEPVVVFQSDCAACRGWCCIIPPFDAVQGFAFDKAAHTACPNLQDDCRCGVHDDLLAHGFAGCAAYDCHGAGQSLTRWLGERGWAQTKATTLHAGPVSAQFGRLDRLHRLGALLTTALEVLPPHHDLPRRRLQAWLHRVREACQQSLSDTPLALSEVSALQVQVMTELRSLRELVQDIL